MAKHLSVEIVTHDGVVFSGDADGLVAPGLDGYFGMLPNHAPLIAELGIGDLRLRHGQKWEHFAISGGILHLRDGQALVMADAAEAATAIDIQRAEEAAERARQRLAQRGSAGIDVTRAEIALTRALNRLRVAQNV